MIKRALMVTGGVVLAGAVLVGRDAFSYLRTSAGYATDAVQEAVPVEFQVDRARRMIEDLVPEVRKNMHLIAKEEVEVERLDEQVAETQSRLDKEKEQLLRLKADLATAKDQFTYAGRSYTAGGSADRSGRPVRPLQDRRGDARESARNPQRAAEEPGGGPRQARRHVGLEAAVAGRGREPRGPLADARRQPRPRATTSSTTAGWAASSSWWPTLRSRLQVAEKLVNAEASYHDQIPLDKPTPENIVEQVSEHFAPKAAKEAGKLAKQ